MRQGRGHSAPSLSSLGHRAPPGFIPDSMSQGPGRVCSSPARGRVIRGRGFELRPPSRRSQGFQVGVREFDELRTLGRGGRALKQSNMVGRSWRPQAQLLTRRRDAALQKPTRLSIGLFIDLTSSPHSSHSSPAGLGTREGLEEQIREEQPMAWVLRRSAASIWIPQGKIAKVIPQLLLAQAPLLLSVRSLVPAWCPPAAVLLKAWCCAPAARSALRAGWRHCSRKRPESFRRCRRHRWV